MQCQARTRRQARCPIEDATPVDGKWYCHVHHPDRLFQKQLAARRVEKSRRPRHFKNRGAPKAADYDDQLRALRAAKGIT